jgi:hypothetical protein
MTCLYEKEYLGVYSRSRNGRIVSQNGYTIFATFQFWPDFLFLVFSWFSLVVWGLFKGWNDFGIFLD